MSHVKISVIMPIYNVENFLEECLDSVLQQDFQDYEIICVDDASTDASSRILLAYKSEYIKIKVIVHTGNKGLAAARNTALMNASGTYIMFVDSDDMIVSGTLAELYRTAEEKQADIVCFDHATICGKKENDIDLRVSYGYEGVYSGRKFFSSAVENRELKTTAWSYFIRKDFLEKNKIRFYEGLLHEDNLFVFLCLMEAKRVININKKFYIYRKRKGSIMDTYSFKRAESYFVIMVQVLTYWNSHSFSDRENQAMEYYFRDLHCKYLRMRWFEKSSEQLEIGGFVEKVVYSVIHGGHRRRWLTLNDTHLSRIKAADNVIVFGAGMGSMDIVDILKEQDVKIDVIAVSDVQENPKTFCGIIVDAIEDVANYLHDAIVIIGVTKKNRLGIMDKLKLLGYRNIILPDSIAEISSV